MNNLDLFSLKLRLFNLQLKQFAEDEGDGVWRTIRGRRVFIREGEDVESALARSLKGGEKGESENHLGNDTHTQDALVKSATEAFGAADKKFGGKTEIKQRQLKRSEFKGFRPPIRWDGPGIEITLNNPNLSDSKWTAYRRTALRTMKTGLRGTSLGTVLEDGGGRLRMIVMANLRDPDQI